MQIKLNWLSLKNFKGIKEYTLTLNGKNAVIKADNGKGKTSLYDGFLWLLFDKNSDNSAKFSAKPLDESGNEIHFLETEVEAELLIDGKAVKLKKVMTENWVKPRGQENKEYKGNTTTYFFDEVPAGANEYKAKVGAIVNEDTFKLITNPMYFCTQYKLNKKTDWQSRRVKLFEMCGNLADDEIIAASTKLSPLPEILNGKSVDDRKAIIKISIKKLNDWIEKIGPKINENMRLIPETPVDYSKTENHIAMLKTQLDELDEKLYDASECVITVQKKHNELYALKDRLANIKSRIDDGLNAERLELLKVKQKVADDKYTLESNIKRLKQSIEDHKRDVVAAEQQRKNLLDQWKSLNEQKQNIQAREFVEPDETSFNCTTCGQALPEDAKKQKIKELKERFEKNKGIELQQVDTSLQLNVTKGQACKGSIENLQKTIHDLEPEIIENEKKLQQHSAKLEEIEAKLLQPIVKMDYIENSEYAETAKQIAELETELEKPVEDVTTEIHQKKQEIQSEIDRCNYILNNKKVVEYAKDRIEELKQDERDSSSQKSMLEGQLFLLDEFVKIKAELLSDSINRRFEHVSFKLFDTQINGGLVECCDILVNTNGCWVPFSDGNTAGKMNAGLDIIQSLIEFHDVSAPVFIDNAEAVTDIIPVDAQVIKLVKPEITTEADRKKYSKLNVEVS